MGTLFSIVSFLVASSHDDDDDDQTLVKENRWFFGGGAIVESVISCFRRFEVKEPRHAGNVFDENCYVPLSFRASSVGCFVCLIGLTEDPPPRQSEKLLA